jgi:hypothetical protein
MVAMLAGFQRNQLPMIRYLRLSGHEKITACFNSLSGNSDPHLTRFFNHASFSSSKPQKVCYLQMQRHGLLFKLTEVYVTPTKVHGTLTEVHGTVAKLHGISTEMHGTPTEVHGTPTEMHGTLTEVYGNPTPSVSFAFNI